MVCLYINQVIQYKFGQEFNLTSTTGKTRTLRVLLRKVNVRHGMLTFFFGVCEKRGVLKKKGSLQK